MLQQNNSQHQDRILNKQKFSQFKKVRNKQNSLLGQHSLYVRNHRKYIGKQLPACQRFITTRPQNYPTFSYLTNKGTKIYLLPLIGQPITGVTLRRVAENQINRWIKKLGCIQSALWQLIKISLEVTQQYKITQIILQCFRVTNCTLIYFYDSWMNNTKKIVRDDPQQLENYYFSQEDLQDMLNINHNQILCSNKKNCLLFRIALLILNLGTSQIKLRNYQYVGFTIKWSNIQERMKIFYSKYNSYGLATFIDRILKNETMTMQQIWGTIKSKKIDKIPRMSVNLKKKPKIDLYQKQNCSSPLSGLSQSFSQNSFSLTPLSQSTNIYSKKKLKLKSQKKADQIENKKDQQMIEKFNIKKRFSQHSVQLSMKLTTYLQLEEFLPNSMYQEKILKIIDKIYIKTNWQRKIYPNGSLYFGELVGDQRQGKGIYLFQSDDFYYGDWSNNLMHGFGIYVFKTGELYQGQLEDGYKHGHGTYYYIDGRKYEGSWLKNSKIGLGTLHFPNNITFFGLFQKQALTQGLFVDQQHQKQWSGILQHYHFYKDCDKKQLKEAFRKQKLKDCKVQYYSQFTTLNGSLYKGQCLNDKKHGYGILQNQNQIYQGNWKNDLQNGQGILTIQNLFTISGNWKDGILYQYKS